MVHKNPIMEQANNRILPSSSLTKATKTEHKPARHIGAFALMLTGLGSIIGSGWLFGAARAANIAGPAAVVAWIGGMIIILSIALSYAELGAMFPEAGGMVPSEFQRVL